MYAAPLLRRPTRAAIAGLALTGLVLTGLTAAAPPAGAATAAPVRVLVELAAPPALAAAEGSATQRARAMARATEAARTLAADQRELLAAAGDDGIEAEPVYALTTAYNGLVVDVPAAQMTDLAALPGVRAVHPDTTYTMSLDDSVPLVGAPDIWELTGPDGRPATGAGIVVAVIDTGVDHTHPDLGGRVLGGYDLVNDDPEPMDDNGHGTHVAGIVAADGAVRGVATAARLTAYKVLGRGGTGQMTDIIAGIEAAVAVDNPHPADVVNLSLSGPGDGTDPMSVAAAQVAAAGTVVVGAAGNDGPNPATVRSPAAAGGVLAVGASASGIQVPRARLVKPATQDLHGVRFEFSANPPAQPARLDVVDIGEGTPGSYEDIDVAGKAVLINMTNVPYPVAAYAEQRGAAAALFYTPDYWGSVPGSGGGIGPGVGPNLAGGAARDAFDAANDAFDTGIGAELDDGRLDRLVTMQIPGAKAALLLSHLADGPATVEITAHDATDQLGDFSSRGPTGSFAQKPDLVAPGVEVLSTLPAEGYGRGTGTSMAAPHVAGAAALLAQLYPEWTGGQISAALAGSAKRLDAGPLEQGAGRLDLPAAVAAAQLGVVATPTALSFGLADLAADGIDRTATVTLHNLGDAPAKVTLSAASEADASIAVTPRTATVEPGQALRVEVRVSLPTPAGDVDVTGWVAVDVTGGAPLSVPFLLPVRHLSVHATPDPAPAGTQTSVYVSSPAELAEPPALTVTCPKSAPQRPPVTVAGTRIWRATVQVGVAVGVCRVAVIGTADARYGEPLLSGGADFEVVTTPNPGQGTSAWQSVGPNSEAGYLVLGDEYNQMSVVTGSLGVLASTDQLRSWQERRTMPVAAGSVAGVEVEPGSAERYFVAVNGGGQDRSYAGRVLYTTDGGARWQIVPRLDAQIEEIALDEAGTALAVADRNGISVSADLGATWTELPAGSSGLRDLHWIGPDLYLANNTGLQVVRDAAGIAPKEAETVFRPGVLGWAGRVAGDAETVVVSAYPTPWVYTSSDGGATFDLSLQATGISVQQLKLVGDDIYAQQASNLWVGRDRGGQWESWGNPAPGAIMFDFGTTPGPKGSLYLSSNGAGIYAAAEPGAFERVGAAAGYVYAVTTAAGADGPTVVAGTVRDSFHTVAPDRDSIRPEDREWQSSGGEGIAGAVAEFLATSPADPSVVYKVRTDAFLTFGVWRSDDGGATWQRKASPSEFAYGLLVHPADPDRVYVSYASLTGAGLVASTDGGETWRKLDHGRIFEALAGDPTDPDRIWAGNYSGLYLSEDGGVSFRKLSSTPTTSIAVDPADPRHVVVGGRALFESRDGGATMRPAAHVDLDMWVTDLEFTPDGSGAVYAATGAFYDELGVLHGGRGVLVSRDGGSSWESFGRGLSNLDTKDLAFSADGERLYAATYGSSVHRITLDD